MKEIIFEDEYGKKMKVIKVFFFGVGYLKDYLLKVCWKCIIKLEEEYDIKWVLIVFVIWNDLLKLFLKEVVEKVFLCIFFYVLNNLNIRFVIDSW